MKKIIVDVNRKLKSELVFSLAEETREWIGETASDSTKLGVPQGVSVSNISEGLLCAMTRCLCSPWYNELVGSPVVFRDKESGKTLKVVKKLSSMPKTIRRMT